MCRKREGRRRHQKEANDVGVVARYRRGRKRVGPRLVGKNGVDDDREEFKRDGG